MGWTKAAIGAALALSLSACSDQRASETPAVSAGRVEADDTGRNVRDRDDATLTPLDQSNSAPDIALTQKIRSGITSKDGMSTEARNVKVIAQNGAVTLRGPVKTEQEKSTIEALARSAGAARVDNQLEIDRD
jgi:osmotically-inducible protein OsmY